MKLVSKHINQDNLTESNLLKSPNSNKLLLHFPTNSLVITVFFHLK